LRQPRPACQHDYPRWARSLNVEEADTRSCSAVAGNCSYAEEARSCWCAATDMNSRNDHSSHSPLGYENDVLATDITRDGRTIPLSLSTVHPAVGPRITCRKRQLAPLIICYNREALTSETQNVSAFRLRSR
jgi:hypothetical protein